MRHCVGSYASFCVEHNFRIFSLTKENAVRSTLCIHPVRPGHWQVYQNQGFRNCEVPPLARVVGHEVCRLYGQLETALHFASPSCSAPICNSV